MIKIKKHDIYMSNDSNDHQCLSPALYIQAPLSGQELEQLTLGTVGNGMHHQLMWVLNQI